MKRRLLNLLAAASLLLGVAVFALWMRSLSTTDGLRWMGRLEGYGVESRGGLVVWCHYYYTADLPSPSSGWQWQSAAGRRWLMPTPTDNSLALREPPSWRRLGFGRDFQMTWGMAGAPQSVVGAHGWYAPHWFVLGLVAPPAVARAVGFARRRARLYGRRCPACGYDLRATPDRCPECGRAAAAKSAEPATEAAA